ncbi:MAG: hypothetical protein Q8R37_04975 [Nanoarchaeota archaeon]|nr:hypothetical protein [Nanoarchaeota archaeon]
MTAYELDDFINKYFYGGYRCGTPDIFTNVSSNNCDPSAHYSLEQVEQMLDGDDFEGITLNNFPLGSDWYRFISNGNLIAPGGHFGFKNYIIKCD